MPASPSSTELFIKRKRTVGDNKEERANALSSFVAHRQFCAVVLIYPTAHGKQPIMEILPQGVGGVSTHALHTEGNRANSLFPRSRTDFYPRPPHRGRHQATIELGDKLQFLPTPSTRRATMTSINGAKSTRNFYPRPPHGGRQKSTIGVNHSLQTTVLFPRGSNCRFVETTHADWVQAQPAN